MVRRSPRNRQTECDVHRPLEIERLGRNESLIMEHRQRHIEAFSAGLREKAVGGKRPLAIDALAARPRDGRSDDVHVLTAEQSSFAGVGIEPAYCDARLSPEQRYEGARQKLQLAGNPR